MQYRKLGKTDVQVSQISLGCWTLGGPNWSRGQPIGWADVDEDEAIAAVNHAVDAGVNHFDNADIYGSGRAERLLAKALGRRVNDVVIATKVGHLAGSAEHAYDPLHIRHQCEQSLKNLGRERVDIYYFHHGNFGPNDCYLDGALEMFHRLREQGKFRLLGLSCYSHEDFVRLVPRVRPDVLQAKANALEDTMIRAGSPTRRLMEEQGLSMVCFSPLGQGLLLNKFRPERPPHFAEGDVRGARAGFSAEALAKLAPRLDRLVARFGADPKDLARVAIQYLLSHPVVACAIPGFRNVAQVQSNLAGADRPLSPQDVEFVRTVFGD